MKKFFIRYYQRFSAWIKGREPKYRCSAQGFVWKNGISHPRCPACGVWLKGNVDGSVRHPVYGEKESE